MQEKKIVSSKMETILAVVFLLAFVGAFGLIQSINEYYHGSKGVLVESQKDIKDVSRVFTYVTNIDYLESDCGGSSRKDGFIPCKRAWYFEGNKYAEKYNVNELFIQATRHPKMQDLLSVNSQIKKIEDIPYGERKLPENQEKLGLLGVQQEELLSVIIPELKIAINQAKDELRRDLQKERKVNNIVALIFSILLVLPLAICLFYLLVLFSRAEQKERRSFMLGGIAPVALFFLALFGVFVRMGIDPVIWMTFSVFIIFSYIWFPLAVVWYKFVLTKRRLYYRFLVLQSINIGLHLLFAVWSGDSVGGGMIIFFIYPFTFHIWYFVNTIIYRIYKNREV